MFKRIADRADRKTAALRNTKTSAARTDEVVRMFLRESVGVADSVLVSAEYTPDRDIVVRVSSKSVASNIVLRMTELRADLRARGIAVRRVVVR
jgi:hypothetical protein